MIIKRGMGEEYGKFVEVNSHDGCGYAVLKYMHKLADNLEKAILNGEGFSRELIYKSSLEAGVVSGIMDGFAMNAIYKFWEYGDSLKAFEEEERAKMEQKVKERMENR